MNRSIFLMSFVLYILGQIKSTHENNSGVIQIFEFKKNTRSCVEIDVGEAFNPENDNVTEFMISLKVMNDGFNSEEYSKMEKEKF